MILIELKKYLQSKPILTLEETARHFSVDPFVMKKMLGHWIRKGKLVQLANPPECGKSCQACDPKTAEEYQWMER